MTSPQHPTTAKSLRFAPDGQDYVAGDERTYWVTCGGYTIGAVERAYLVSAREGGEPTLGWGFRGGDGRWGEGRSRAAAVLNAYEAPAAPALDPIASRRDRACAEADVSWAWLLEAMTPAEADAWLGIDG